MSDGKLRKDGKDLKDFRGMVREELRQLFFQTGAELYSGGDEDLSEPWFGDLSCVDEDYREVAGDILKRIKDPQVRLSVLKHSKGREFGFGFRELLYRIAEVDEGCTHVVLDAVDKVVGLDNSLAYNVLRNSPKLLVEAEGDVCADYLLVKSVRDQRDANIVSQVIENGIESTEKAYGEEYGRFF